MLLVAFIISYLLLCVLAFGNLIAEVDRPLKIVLNQVWFFSFFAICLFFIVFRSYNTIGDTMMYSSEIFPRIGQSNSLAAYNDTSPDTVEPLFYFIAKAVYFIGNSRLFFLISFLIFLVPAMIGVWLVWPRNTVLAIFSYASLFVFYSLNMNIIRNGTAAGWWILGIALMHKRHWKLLVLCILISLGFHFTSILFWSIVMFSWIVRNYLVVGIFGTIALVASYMQFDISNLFLSLVSDDDDGMLAVKLLRYGNKVFDENYNTGFRLDFVVFNMFFLAVAGLYLFVFRYKNDFYSFLVRSYIYLTGFFFLSFQIPGTDRFGILSWILIPFITLYPLHEGSLKTNMPVKLSMYGVTVLHGIVSIILIKHLFIYT